MTNDNIVKNLHSLPRPPLVVGRLCYDDDDDDDNVETIGQTYVHDDDDEAFGKQPVASVKFRLSDTMSANFPHQFRECVPFGPKTTNSDSSLHISLVGEEIKLCTGIGKNDKKSN